MATAKENKVPQTEETNETKTEATEQIQENQSNVVDLTKEPKKGGFFRDMSIGMKIGAGLFFGSLAFGAGFLIKKVFFNGDDDDDAIPVDGSVSDSSEE